MKKYLFSLLIGLVLAISAGAQTTYQERAQLARDADFRGRVTFAMLEAASAILADTSDASKALYLFAGRLMLEPTSTYFVDQFVYSVLTNPVINGSSTDSDLAFTVNSQFTKIATAYRRERGEIPAQSANAQRQ